MKTRIMILYSETGGGHRSLALALTKYLNKYSNIEVLPFNHFSRWMENIYGVFGGPLRVLYGVFFHMTNSKYTRFFASLPTKMMIYPLLEKTFRDMKPDVVITNHPLLCADLRNVLRKASCPHTKVVVHVADPFTPHAVWFSSPDSDMFLLPTDETKEVAITYGIPPTSCEVVGWFLRPQFLDLTQNIRYEPGYPYVFIGSGGQGAGNTFELMKAMIDHPSFLQSYGCVVNTGSNVSLEQSIRAYAEKKKTQHLLVLPSTDAIDEYMRGACFVGGKLGPNFLFESLALEKAIMATSFIPGQEEGNVTYVQEKNIGWVELDPKKAVEQMYEIFQNKAWVKLLPQIQREKKKYVSSAEGHVKDFLQKLIE
ncbi:MAG: hypothetical protein HZA34_02475 [Candidatus Pacebacteria bacterium]|nr:hypothetical protein [Candidatus Paceibacterota bacterium]